MSNETKIRTVLVGCGEMSSTWLDTVRTMPEVEMVGLVDIVEEAARRKAREFDLPNALIATDLASILAQTPVDAVFNCTIPAAHYAVTMLALQHGCHVLSEKPLADTLEHAREMVAAAEQAGKIFAVIQNRRYDLNMRRLRHFLSSETLGPLTTVNSDFYVGPHFGGFRDHMKHVLLLDMAIHSFDAARFLMGVDPVSVYCKEWNPAGSWFDHGASAMATFEMANGIIYSYRGSWCSNGLPTTWECDWRFACQVGTATWDGSNRFRAQKVKEPSGYTYPVEDVEIPPYTSDKVGGHAGLIRDFFRCIQQGTQPETVASDNIKSLAMVLAAIESAETGRPVDIHW